jgi:hypothetical protein
MRNLLALSAAGVLVFLGLGWYLGWYKVSSTPGPEGHRQISIDVNTPKIAEDVKAKVHDLTSNKNEGPPPITPGTPVSARTNENGDYVFPADVAPPPPLGTPKLPMPQ